MAFKIIWSAEAYKTFTQNIEYLKEQWSEREIEKFTKRLNEVLIRINEYPEVYPPSQKNKEIRKAKLNKYITLYFSYDDVRKEIYLVTFWNIKQDPRKLNY